jgi:magnesium-transporting ATPase (P-type)
MRDPNQVVRDFITALILCHNVTPVYPDEFNPEKKELEASSPDEIALVKFAEHVGLQLIQREQNYIKISKNGGKHFEVGNLFNCRNMKSLQISHFPLKVKGWESS